MKDSVAALVAAVAAVAYVVVVAVMWEHIDDTDAAWSRRMLLFSGVEAMVFAAVGWLFGKEVNRGAAEAAERANNQANEETRLRAAAEQRDGRWPTPSVRLRTAASRPGPTHRRHRRWRPWRTSSSPSTHRQEGTAARESILDAGKADHAARVRLQTAIRVLTEPVRPEHVPILPSPAAAHNDHLARSRCRARLRYGRPTCCRSQPLPLLHHRLSLSTDRDQKPPRSTLGKLRVEHVSTTPWWRLLVRTPSSSPAAPPAHGGKVTGAPTPVRAFPCPTANYGTVVTDCPAMASSPRSVST